MTIELQALADLIRERNENATRITELIGRPAQIGHIGEFIETLLAESFLTS